MKKFNRLIFGMVICYIIVAIGTGILLSHDDRGKTGEYKIEINRLVAEIQKLNQPDSEENTSRTSSAHEISMENIIVPDLSGCTYVKEIHFLEQSQFMDETERNAFFLAKNKMSYQIEPLYINSIQAGYLRFDYQMEYDLSGFLIHIEAILAIMEIAVLGILFYIRQNVIKPFVKFSNIPFELAKGHLKGDIEESKNRFFGNFIWGIGLLKDRLDSTKKKELKLEKEKKMMLLSISHDIKTPLNNIKLYAKALEENLYESKEEEVQAARKIGEKTIEIENFVSEIVKTSSEDILEIEVKDGEFYLDTLVELVKNAYSELCAYRHLNLVIEPNVNKLIKGDLDRTLS